MAGANTRDLRRRIRSIKNTAQLTKAMKMVSAAKLRRAQDAMLGARPYAAALRRTLAGVAQRADRSLNPLLADREPERLDLVVLTSDRGLCGAFNANIIKAAESWRLQQRGEIEITAIGRKAVEHYKRRPHIHLRDKIENYSKTFDFKLAADLAKTLEERFLSGASDGVFVAFNEFKSVVSQRVLVQPLLPFSRLDEEARKSEDEEPSGSVDYLYEPAPEGLLEAVISRFVAFEVYHALLESTAAEHAARMTAMDNASRNANEMIQKLTLQMNRIRQAAITTEIIEVVSGAEALG